MLGFRHVQQPEETTLPAVRSSKSGKSSDSKPVSSPPAPATPDPIELAALVAQQLEDDKAENILNIPLAGKSPMADAMVVASGRSARHVAALADKVHRKLKELTNQTTRDFIRNLRLKQAARLLAIGHDNISEISERVGFSNVSIFSRAFKETYGMSPKAYREQKIEEE